LDAARRQGDVEWLSEEDLQRTLENLARHPSDWNSGRDTGRWSLAGAQSKVALFRSESGRWGIPRDSTPTTHILKPSMPDYEGAPSQRASLSARCQTPRAACSLDRGRRERRRRSACLPTL
jgi:hypothetical protein